MIDIQKRDALLTKVGAIEDGDNIAVWVEVEEFFDGNEDLGSFWCNLAEQPEEMSQIFGFLRSIRSRSDVHGLRVCVSQFDGGEEEWPFSDTILVVTDTSKPNVQSWFERFPPDEILVEENDKLLSNLGYVGKTALRLWWD
ncbi:MAG: hypothetical protein AAFR68_23095 [Pseudomonadota bacterium]